MKKALLIAGALLGHSTFAQLYTPSGTTQSTTNSSSNNVGIGTNNPLAPLDIRGRILINPDSPVWGVGIRGYSTYWARGYNFLNSDGTLKIGGFGAAGPKDEVDSYFIGKEWNDNIVRFYPGDNRSIFYGNVGIGTANPLAKLDIAGDLKSNNHTIVEYSPTLFLDRSTNSGGYIQGIQTRLSDGSNNWFFGNLHADSFLITTGDYTGPKQFVINRNGNAALQGKLEAKELKVTLTPTADFVFEEDYNLPKLEDVERHIKNKKHLPEIASAKEMEKEGVNIGEFQIKLLQKIEELTLYVIEQNKQIKEDKLNLKDQSEKIKQLEQELEILKIKK